jgi:TRAP-type transport system periplasmic protein
VVTSRIARRTLLRNAATLPIGASLSPAVVGRARAATTRLRLSSSQANDPKYANGRVYYDNLLNSLKANGLEKDITIQFFPDNQLGQEIDVANSVKLGVIDLMVTGTSIWANLVPTFGVLDLGYLFQSFPQQTKALDAGAAKPLEEMLLKGANARVIGWAYNFGARSVLCKTPVEKPEDLAGKKIRTLPNPVITEVLRLMGAAATPLAFGEVYTALQAGVLDGLEHDPPTILASKFYETAKYYCLTEHIFSPLGLFLSGATYKRMDPKLRDGFLDAANKATVETRAHGLAVASEALDTLRSQGVTVVNTDKETFRQRVAPQTDNFLKMHPEAKPIVDVIRSTSA